MIPDYVPIKIITYQSGFYDDRIKAKFKTYFPNGYNIEIYQIRCFKFYDNPYEFGVELGYYSSDEDINFQLKPYHFKLNDNMVREKITFFGSYEEAFNEIQYTAGGIGANTNIQIGNLLFSGSQDSQLKEDWLRSNYNDVINLEKFDIAENNEVR